MIHIRLASEEDAALIAEISRRTFHETFAAYNSRENMQMHMDQYYSLEKIKEACMDRFCCFLLAYFHEQPAGYAMINEHIKEESRDLQDPIEIERIYSKQEMIGKGVGSKLMEACFSIAREKKKKVIWLGVWEHNKRAIDFYIRKGFEKFGEHNFPVGLDPQTDWLMKKTLDTA